jgi:hypothetical protein
MDKLPRVIATSVVRSAHQGESHGGVYLIDLNSGQYDQVIDWNDDSINWEGRGGDRGLRGIAFHNNDTGSNRLVIADRKNRIKQSFDVPKNEPSTLSNAHLPNDHARQGFARGLCLYGDDVVIGGSSPSTVSAYSLATGRRISSINISKDIRNCIHGLEVWPG